MNYFQTLKERRAKSRAYSKHQLTGLLIADLLDDRGHKAVYIKLAKEYSSQKLLSLARDIEERPQVKNKGAYFMRMVQKSKLPRLSRLNPPQPKRPKQLRLKLRRRNKK